MKLEIGVEECALGCPGEPHKRWQLQLNHGEARVVLATENVDLSILAPSKSHVDIQSLRHGTAEDAEGRARVD